MSAGGIEACLWGSAVMLGLCLVITFFLPSTADASRRVLAGLTDTRRIRFDKKNQPITRRNKCVCRCLALVDMPRPRRNRAGVASRDWCNRKRIGRHRSASSRSLRYHNPGR
jgi:hypothetical protein